MQISEAGIWKERFRVRSYEMDPRGRASIVTLCNFLQEAAGNHALDLGVSVDQLQDKNLTWVLARLRMEVDAYPLWRDEVVIETWPSGAEGLFATRDFLLRDDAGVVLARATSSWLMIDLERRRPVRLPEFITSIDLPDRDRSLVGMSRQLSEGVNVVTESGIRVRYSDLDINGHVNNVRYVEWALEAVPFEIIRSHHLAELEVHFRAEAVYGDPVEVSLASMDGSSRTYSHVITQTNDDRELARLQTRWSDQ